MLQVAQLIADHALEKQVLAKQAGLKPAAFSRLINHGEWPKRKDISSVKAQINEALKAAGVHESSLHNAWEVVAATDHAQSEVTTTMLAGTAGLSQAALTHFHLTHRQARQLFPRDLDTEQYYPITGVARSQHHENNIVFHNIADLIRDMCEDIGFLGIAGEVGSGKTTSLAHAIQQLDDSVVVIEPLGAILDQENDATRINAATISKSIVRRLSKETPKSDKEERMFQIQRLLEDASHSEQRFVLVIDHGDTLHIETLKALKRLWELKGSKGRKRGKHLLGIVLVGQPELLEKLATIGKSAAREVYIRMSMVEIMPLTEQQVHEFLDLKFQGIGKPLTDVFEEDAFSAIHKKLTQHEFCYPQTLQNFVIHCMHWVAHHGVNRGITHVDADVVEAVK